ncbi:MAG TPA: hypothetical protein VFQ61_24175 [Polyangiaceae bacterium]|nr:hypothetical protein [Polyangiaceae bacterium]
MKSMLLRNSLALISLASLVACGETLDPGSRVTSFRVLAQQMDSPYAAPGETVHVTSLVADPQSRPIHWAWAMCVNPISSEVGGCMDKIQADSEAKGSALLIAEGVGVDAVDVTVPSDALSSLPESARSQASVGVLSVACPGTLSIASGASELPFRCVETGTGRELGLHEFVVGVKRIVVRDRDRNLNPSIARVTFDGMEWPETEVKRAAACHETGNDFSCPDSLQHKIAAEPTPQSIETGVSEFSQDFSEQVVVQYYASEGTFENETRIASNPETKWAPRDPATGQDLTFWFVVRDNRGGVTWTTRQLHVE